MVNCHLHIASFIELVKGIQVTGTQKPPLWNTSRHMLYFSEMLILL